MAIKRAAFQDTNVARCAHESELDSAVTRRREAAVRAPICAPFAGNSDGSSDGDGATLVGSTDAEPQDVKAAVDLGSVSEAYPELRRLVSNVSAPFIFCLLLCSPAPSELSFPYPWFPPFVDADALFLAVAQVVSGGTGGHTWAGELRCRLA